MCSLGNDLFCQINEISCSPSVTAGFVKSTNFFSQWCATIREFALVVEVRDKHASRIRLILLIATITLPRIINAESNPIRSGFRVLLTLPGNGIISARA